MNWLILLLQVGSFALPRPYRARWLEEALAVLYEVHGWRRWWYGVDTALKAPLLAREYQRGPVLPPRWLTMFAGATLAVWPAFTLGVLILGQPDDGRLVASILLLPLGLLPVVAGRSFHVAARRGGGAVRYAAAAVLTAAIMFGPFATIRAALAERGDVTVLGMTLLGGWLVWVNLTILRRRIGAADQATLGLISGVPIAVLPIAAVQGGSLASSLVFFGMGMTVPVLGTWCLLAGLRMLAGRPDLMLDRPLADVVPAGPEPGSDPGSDAG